MRHADADLAAMQRALELARQSLLADDEDVPVGALVLGPAGDVLAESANRREALTDPTAHAEVMVLREAALALDDTHLVGCTLVVTLEPCPMCAGAAQLARVDRVVFGAWNEEQAAAPRRLFCRRREGAAVGWRQLPPRLITQADLATVTERVRRRGIRMGPAAGSPNLAPPRGRGWCARRGMRGHRARILRPPTVSPRGAVYPLRRWRVRAAKGARLESVCGGNSTVGSNPTATAKG